MKALVVSALSDDLSGVALADVPEPSTAPGKVLVRMRAAALNFPDLLMTRGAYQLKPPLPFVLGMEMAGEVIAADPASGFALGDRVVAGTRTGAFAQIVACDAAAIRPIPPGIDFPTAAGMGAAYLTAYVALVRLAGIAPGDRVLVHGATGGVGLAAVDLAIALGARVIATSRSPAKLAIVADAYAVETTLPAVGFREAVKAQFGGGADIIFDPVGGDVFDESARCTAFGARLLVVGFTSGRIATVATNNPAHQGLRRHRRSRGGIWPAIPGARPRKPGRDLGDGRRTQDRAARPCLLSSRRVAPRIRRDGGERTSRQAGLDRWWRGRMTYDHIIVGGGSAGCTLAARLTEDPAVRVLLLEAGGANKEMLVRMPAGVGNLIKAKSKHNWGFWTEPEPHLDNRRLWWPRGRGLGGSSAINGMVYMRGHPLDYDEWRQMGLPGWSFADVLPYFRRLEGATTAAAICMAATGR